MAIDLSILAKLEPISTLSPSRLSELASLCFVEKVSKDIDPFRMNVVKSAQAMYLLSGELGLKLTNGSSRILKAGSEDAHYPVDIAKLGLKAAIALSEIEILRIDLDLLDIMMTWDQLATVEDPVQHPKLSNSKEQKRDLSTWMNNTSAFGVEKLQNGVFSKLPSANIEEMFRRMVLLEVAEGQVIITQGSEGDYYYLIKDGSAVVSRTINPGNTTTILAELKTGDAFGEEALVSENKRNATVTMKTDGFLFRLKKIDFVELLKAPLINQVDMAEAKKIINSGAAIWLDTRLPSEYKFDHLQDAISFPLNQLRGLMAGLDNAKQYITYCQTGRRSSAAAFVLIQHGFNVLVLSGGTRGTKV